MYQLEGIFSDLFLPLGPYGFPGEKSKIGGRFGSFLFFRQFPVFSVCEREILGKFISNNLAKITLPKSVKSCDPARPLQESPRPSGPGTPNSLQESLPGPSGPGVEKCPKQSQNSLRSLLRPGDCFETLSDTFSTLGRKAPGDSLGDFLGVPGPCKGRAGSQIWFSWREKQNRWTFRIFFIFLLGEGEGGVRGARKGGGPVLY